MDLYHRVRAFPPEVSVWRKHLIGRLLQDAGRFRGIGPGATEQTVREHLDEGIAALREIARVLAAVHGTPRLGNKEDPVDELVYIILARKTRERAYQETFDTLKRRFPTWDDLLSTPRRTVKRLVEAGGLGEKKTESLYGALGVLRETFGKCTLDPAREWSDDRLETFLCSLPEISRKSAYCIMMYALGRQVLPVDTHVGRVLARLGLYRELGLNLDGLNHKQLQAVLADLVPPNLRYALHVNLLAHGRTVCRAARPLCDRCEVRRFCRTFRQAEVARVSPRAPTAVDLFCGAGGLSEGFRRAGFRTLAALDSDPSALRTYWLNHSGVPDHRIVLRDVRDLAPGELRRLVGRQRVDVLLGAPPCQGFSHAGNRSKRRKIDYRVATDERNYLFRHMVRAAVELRPRLVLMENVPGMQSARGQGNLSFLEAAGRELSHAGFTTEIWRLNAAAVGVPQDRIRYFLVAAREGRLPARPVEDYRDEQRRDMDPDALPPVSLDEAIFDLPPRGVSSGSALVRRRDRTGELADPRVRRYLEKFGLLTRSELVYNHAARFHNERDLRLYSLLRPGEDSIHLLERHGAKARKVMRYRTDAFDDKHARLRGDRPCRTITAHLAKDGNSYVHPIQLRSITVREAARVQSFGDDYVFCGPVSEQWHQVGNAVPPIVAEAIARSFLHVLSASRSRR
jgi:DNA (cytosine-5)-methyltransferase 1